MFAVLQCYIETLCCKNIVNLVHGLQFKNHPLTSLCSSIHFGGFRKCGCHRNVQSVEIESWGPVIETSCVVYWSAPINSWDVGKQNWYPRIKSIENAALVQKLFTIALSWSLWHSEERKFITTFELVEGYFLLSCLNHVNLENMLSSQVIHADPCSGECLFFVDNRK